MFTHTIQPTSLYPAAVYTQYTLWYQHQPHNSQAQSHWHLLPNNTNSTLVYSRHQAALTATTTTTTANTSYTTVYNHDRPANTNTYFRAAQHQTLLQAAIPTNNIFLQAAHNRYCYVKTPTLRQQHTNSFSISTTLQPQLKCSTPSTNQAQLYQIQLYLSSFA